MYYRFYLLTDTHTITGSLTTCDSKVVHATKALAWAEEKSIDSVLHKATELGFKIIVYQSEKQYIKDRKSGHHYH